MSTRCTSLVVAFALACSSGEGGDSADGGDVATMRDASVGEALRDAGPDAGPATPPACANPVELTVSRGGEAFEVVRARVAGGWSAFAGREIFRLLLETDHDPVPEAVDDEVTVVSAIDLVPSELLERAVGPLAIDQQVAVPGFARSYVDDTRVVVRPAAGHAHAIRRVLVEQSGFGTNPQPASYHVTGELSVGLSPGHRITGRLELSIDGAIPLAFGGADTTRIEGCFAFDVEPPVECQPGETCGNDCLAAEEWGCWDCGALYRTHDCACRPDLPPLEECADDTPAALGDLCGAEWWCDRRCGEGLTCRLDPGHGEGGEGDAGAGGLCDHYRTCQPAVEADECVVARRLDSCCPAYVAVSRGELAGDTCLVQVPVGPIFGTDVVDPCLGESCVGVDCAFDEPPSHLAVKDGGGGCRLADECFTDDDCVLGRGASGCCDCPRSLPAALFDDNECAVRDGDSLPGAACLGCSAPVECGTCEAPTPPRCVEHDGLRVCE